jgi:formylglycine-generating enzyme required for sulfatase activity
VRLRWKYGSNGLDLDSVDIQVFAIEMVYVPQGSFAAGSGGSENSAFTLTTINTATATTAPTGSGGFSGSAEGGYPSGQTAPANASWPNGYDAFYCMKYEISQGHYRDFLNTLTYAQQVNRTGTSPSSGARTGALVSNNSTRSGIDIQSSGVDTTYVPAIYGCNMDGDGNFNESNDGEWVACHFIIWADVCAYLDWAGLRPMTELEYEKACRGDQAPVANEYAWGSTSITGATGISNGGANNETFSNAGANCAIASATTGPLRVGAFAGGATTRAQAGATYYGIMEMSGSLWERVVSIGHGTGRAFTGTHGNGALSSAGNANATSWPGTSAIGSGLRGSNWGNQTSWACVSDRTYAVTITTTTVRYNRDGGRGVRTATQ